MSSLVVVATTTPAAAHPGHPGEAHEPVVLYHETFDSAAPPMMLDEYVRADGGRYRADPQIRSLAERLGQLNGTEPAADNVAVAAYTAGDPGVAQPVQFATVEPIDTCDADGDIGTFTSDTGILFTGSQVGIEMTNATGSGIGNDAGRPGPHLRRRVRRGLRRARSHRGEGLRARRRRRRRGALRG